GLVGEARRVGPHVGDEAGALAALHLDALVELLGHAHGLLGAHAELDARGLLERGGRERRRRLLADGLGLDRANGVGALARKAGEPFGVVAVGKDLLDALLAGAADAFPERLAERGLEAL